MTVTSKTVLLKKNFVSVNVNSVFRNYGLFYEKSKVLNLIVLSQIKSLIELFGKNSNRSCFFNKKIKYIFSFNNIFKKKKLRDKRIRNNFISSLKTKGKFFLKKNIKNTLVLNSFIWKVWNYSHKIIPLYTNLNSLRFLKPRIFFIKNLIKFSKNFDIRKKKLFGVLFLKRNSLQPRNKVFSFLQLKQRIIQRKNVFFNLLKFRYFQVKRLLFFFKAIISVLDVNFYKKFVVFLKSEFSKLKYLFFLIFFRNSLKKISLSFSKNFKSKTNIFFSFWLNYNLLFTRKLPYFNKKVRIKKFKFYLNFINKFYKCFGNPNIKKRKDNFLKTYLRKSFNFYTRKKSIEYLTFKCLSPQKPLLNLFLTWNNYYVLNFRNFKKLYRRKKLKISSFNLGLLNNHLVVFLNVFKYKKKPIQIFQKRQLTNQETLLLKINQHKAINRTYRHINNSLLSLNLLQKWLAIFKMPLCLKVSNAFVFDNVGWWKLFKIFKKSFSLGKFTNSRYFPSALLSTLMMVHYRNPMSLNKNLSEILEKQWRHRPHLFFLYFLIMGVLWQFELKKLTSLRKVKTVYMTVRGKINSGIRTKYFQVKAQYKPSMLTLQNHMNFTKGVANAKTGTFGIQSWVHY